ncbi:MAG TPA: SDR family NAD(P)-dependent oxidoreductase [Beijerinckiaceae bacterium]|nr:SDR family NAD(P)-dependent oxidoreductase [Beijerinckiaceae bacterium]
MRSHPSLSDRSIIVTGGSRGLGREMVLALAGAGARLAIVGLNDSPALAATLADARALVGEDKAIPIVADLRRDADCRRIAATTLDAFGRIDVLFSNAGLGIQEIANYSKKPVTKFWETDVEPWNAIVETNVNGVFQMARAVTPGMIAQEFGKIINLSTSRHTMLRLGGSAYGGAKAFVETASRVWAAELAGTGVTVNVFLPGGPVDTGIRSVPLPDGFTFYPIEMMRAPTLWLASDLSNGHTAKRFLARLWNEDLPLERRIATAQESTSDLPIVI